MGFNYRLLYSYFPELFTIANDRPPTKFTYYYYSIVTFTTLGFGDIVPNDIKSEIIITIEVILGYIMLGGLISIFATKFIPKE
ncbi:ion channel [Desulfobacula toluolica]|uniref:ion channel n=1 Tax=Desulfobacula toluolica TaxID=28223 RepID=UPI00059CB476